LSCVTWPEDCCTGTHSRASMAGWHCRCCQPSLSTVCIASACTEMGRDQTILNLTCILRCYSASFFRTNDQPSKRANKKLAAAQMGQIQSQSRCSTRSSLGPWFKTPRSLICDSQPHVIDPRFRLRRWMILTEGHGLHQTLYLPRLCLWTKYTSNKTLFGSLSRYLEGRVLICMCSMDALFILENSWKRSDQNMDGPSGGSWSMPVIYEPFW
jgi:hypothetical protein